MSKVKISHYILELCLNSADDLISIHDRDYRIVWANESFCRFTGKTLEETKGRYCYDVLLCSKVGKDSCPHYNILMDGNSKSFEKAFLLKKNYFLVSAYPVYDKNKKLLATIHIAKDITQIKEMEQNLSEKELFYETIITHMQDIITIILPDGTIKYESPSVKNITGYEIEELLNKNGFEFVHPDDLPGILKIISEITDKPGDSRIVEFRFKNKDGTYHYYESNGINLLHLKRIEGFLLSSRDITTRKELELEVKALKDFTQDILENLPFAVIRFNNNYRPVYENAEARKIFGVPDGELSRIFNYDIRELPVKQRNIVLPIYERTLRGERIMEKVEYVSLYNRHLFLQVTTIPVYEKERISGVLMIFNDITKEKKIEEEKRRIQEELFQVAKIESIGQLAGGIAHDFNNLLTVINGNLDFLRDQLSGSGRDIKDSLDEVRRATDHAASLTSQLLAFSRRQIYKPRVLNLNDVIKNLEKMLIRLIGENINLKTELNPSLKKIKADPTQLEQIIINLVTNSRDAMLNGGILIIKTDNEELKNDLKKEYPFVVPGEYVLLSVKDNGRGMTEEVKSRIFEPFFTTKEMGKGTGLGLAVVYGIVKQNSGFIFIDSEIEKGTVVKIYLPVTSDGEIAEEDTEVIVRENFYGDETILVVEDDESVRKLIVKSLKSAGYTVFEADGARSAFELVQSMSQPVDLLLTDVVLPDSNGKVLAERLKEVGRVKNVLFMSGYTKNIIAKHGLVDEGIELINKPFTPVELLKSIRNIIKR